MPKPESISALATLVRDLAAQHHDGVLYRMAPRVGLSMSLLDQWSKGLVKEPSLGSLRKLAAAYGLEFSAVLEAAYPEPKKKVLASRRLVGVLVALGVGWAAVAPPLDEPRGPWATHPLPVVTRPAGNAPYQKLRGWWVWWGAVADYYLALAWRRGLTTFKVWPRVSMESYGA